MPKGPRVSVKDKPRADYQIYTFTKLHESFRVVHFTDQEWKEILGTFPWSKKFKKNSKIRREQIEAHLNNFLKYSASLRTSLRTKRSVEKITRYIPKLKAELRYLIGDPVFLSAGLPHGWLRPPDFSDLLGALDDLEKEIASTEARIQMNPGRKSIAPLGFLIVFLNQIQSDMTSIRVIRSNKRTDRARGNAFIHLCCRKIGLSKLQVDRAVKRHIKTSNQFGLP